MTNDSHTAFVVNDTDDTLSVVNHALTTATTAPASLSVVNAHNDNDNDNGHLHCRPSLSLSFFIFLQAAPAGISGCGSLE
ncbi:MAG: hypothetical protein MPK03_00725, partial [Alphaproteobacteria bacterium]|nr:hypothetical protein [Alphaproteobacteria bacterium]